MGRACACCTSPSRAEIDVQIATGATSKSIAAGVGLSTGQVARHRRICLRVAPLTEAESVQLWLQRADEMFLQAGINGQVREQCQALASALRCLELSLRRKEELAEQTARELSSDPRSWTDEDKQRVISIFDLIVCQTTIPTGVIRALTRNGRNFEEETTYEHCDDSADCN